MPLSSREMIALLKKNGFEEVSQNGSHLKLCNKAKNITLVVPMHSKELKRGTEQGILKQARLKGIMR